MTDRHQGLLPASWREFLTPKGASMSLNDNDPPAVNLTGVRGRRRQRRSAIREGSRIAIRLRHDAPSHDHQESLPCPIEKPSMSAKNMITAAIALRAARRATLHPRQIRRRKTKKLKILVLGTLVGKTRPGADAGAPPMRDDVRKGARSSPTRCRPETPLCPNG